MRFPNLRLGTVLLVLGCMIGAASAARGQAKQASSAPPSATKPGAISGEVVDKSGTPLAGAEIKWTSEASKEPATVTTDAKGAFHISKLEPGKYLLTITAKGCVPKAQKVTVKAGGTAKVHVRLKPPPAPKSSSM